MTRSTEQILEEYLVVGARLGDQRAIERLVAVRGPRLLGHAARLLGSVEDARDVVQDAWIEILRGLPRLRDERAFPAWAYRIVTRRAARGVAGKVRQRALSDGLAAITEPVADEDGPAAADARTVRTAIARLPPEQAATIALFYLEEMSIAEVALALDIPAVTVKTRLMHARKKLNDLLKGEPDDQA